jgi:erythritol transport system substrate-binding protein
MLRRKVIAAAAVASMAVIGLAGCSDDETAASASGAAPEAGGLIAVIVPEMDNPFFAAEGDAAAAKARDLGYETSVSSHAGDAQKESDLIDAAIEAGAKAIILDNAGADDSIGSIQRATDQGVGVFLIDREINASDIAVAQITSNNAQGATEVAEEFVKALPAGKYIELTGKETDTNAHVRSDAYNAVIGEYPDLIQVAQQTANWSQDEAFTVVETLLQANPDVTGIIAGNDTMAMGAVAAVESQGLTGKVIVAGFDGSPDAVAAIKAGTLLCTGLQPMVTLAQTAAELADEWIRTGAISVDERQSLDCILITKENADKYTSWAMSE